MNDQELHQWLQEVFGVMPKDLNKYKIALTMRQYQVLEFFGDSILGFIISEYLFITYSHSINKPGWFNDVKAALVENRNLTRIANKIGIASVAVIPSTSSRAQVTDNVVADILEALIAAIYLDQGVEKCKEVIEEVFDLEHIIPPVEEQKKEDVILLLEQNNSISTLQELLANKGESPPEYTEIGRVGEPHEPLFTLEATCEFRTRRLVADGTGKSLKEAKKIAAQKLLVKVIELYNYFQDTLFLPQALKEE